MSHSSSSASSRRARLVAPGKSRMLLRSRAVRHDRFDVESLRVRHGALGFRQADQHGPCLLKELRRVVAYVAESLEHHPLALETGRETQCLHVLLHPADLADPKEDTAAGGLDPPADAARAHWLRGHAAECVQFAGAELGVGVGDPGHLARPGTDVGGGDVEPRSHEVLAHQLEDVSPRDPLQLPGRVALWVELDASFGSAERHVHQGAFVGHQRGQRLDLFGIHRLGIPDAALRRQLVMAVLRAPGVHHLDGAVVAFDGEAGVEEILAGLDVGEQSRVVPGECGGVIEGPIDLLEEAGAEGHGRSLAGAEGK